MSILKCRFCFEGSFVAGHCSDTKCRGSRNVENPATALKAGERLKGYQIGAWLGQGGNAMVYAAKQLNIDKRVALKELFPEELVSRVPRSKHVSPFEHLEKRFQSQKKNFLKEANLLAKLKGEQYPEVLAVLDYFEENGTAYVVTGYLDGIDLSELVQCNGPLLGPALAEILRGVIDSVKRVHEVGMLHLDLKPENFKRQTSGRITLMDFGCAAYKDENGGFALRGQMGKTPGYAPPEAALLDESTLTAAQDIYAIGATTYYLATGQHPPSAEERDVGKGFEPSLEWVAKHVSPLIAKFIDVSMRPEAKDRPQTIGQVTALLTPFVNPSEDWTLSLPTSSIGAAIKDAHAHVTAGHAYHAKFNWQPMVLGPVWFAMYKAALPAVVVGAIDAAAVSGVAFLSDYWPIWVALLLGARLVAGLFGNWLVYRSVTETAQEIAKQEKNLERRASVIAKRLDADFLGFSIAFILSLPLLVAIFVIGKAHAEHQRKQAFRQIYVEPLMCAIERHVQTENEPPTRAQINKSPEHSGGAISNYELEGASLQLTLKGEPANGRKVRLLFDVDSKRFTQCVNLDLPMSLLPVECEPGRLLPRRPC